MRFWILPFGLAALLAGSAQAAPACAPAGAAKVVEAAVQGWFAAGRRDDLTAEAAIQAPGFYAYDGGKRFEGMALGELVKAAHASGVSIVWNLHDVDVHVACDQAWAAWVNTGATGKPGAMTPVTWLESAVFGYRDGRWRMEFLHSTHAAPAP
jgi:hypothetical protein